MALSRRNQRRRDQALVLEPIVERVEDEKLEVEPEIDNPVDSDVGKGKERANDARDSEEEEDNDDDERRVTFASVNDLHKGCYVMMKGGFPCKVVEVARSKQGKHGSAKVSITALDIFTGKKYEDLYPSSKNVEVPEVTKIELEVLGVEGGRLQVKQLKDGKPYQPIAVPDDEMGERIRSLMSDRANVVVQLQCAMGKEKIVMARERRTK